MMCTGILSREVTVHDAAPIPATSLQISFQRTRDDRDDKDSRESADKYADNPAAVLLTFPLCIIRPSRLSLRARESEILFRGMLVMEKHFGNPPLGWVIAGEPSEARILSPPGKVFLYCSADLFCNDKFGHEHKLLSARVLQVRQQVTMPRFENFHASTPSRISSGVLTLPRSPQVEPSPISASTGTESS